MAPRLYPDHPEFEDESERIAWESLRRVLRDEDVLLHGVRLTDPELGEVEIDLLVLLPDRGAVVIEVKGGVVTYAQGGFQQSGASDTHDIHPVRQARNGVYALRRFLQHQRTWSRGPLRSAWLLCFPFTDVAGSMGPEGHRDLIVDRREVPDLAGRAFDRMGDPAIDTKLPGAGWVDAVVDLLVHPVAIADLVQARAIARREHVERLTAQQSTLLSFIREIRRYEVVGSAGTGKTWLAMEQARRWAREGERVCFVSYGRGVAEYVARALNEFPERERPAYVGTFHELGWRWGVESADAGDHEAWVTRIPAAMLDAARGLAEDQRFTAFIVDEAQDFADSWWPALLAAAASDDVKLAVFRDDEQAVFSQRRGRPDVQMPRFVLDGNLRNARQIVETFSPLVTAPITAEAGDGFAVEFVACTASTAQKRADDVAMELFDRRGWLPEQIALLTTMHRHPVQRESTDKAAYWDDFWGTDVFYSTVAGFKGLERPVVVLAVDGFHDGIDPRSVMYAGMSRARDLLVIVGEPSVVEAAVGEKVMRRLKRGSTRI